MKSILYSLFHQFIAWLMAYVLFKIYGDTKYLIVFFILALFIYVLTFVLYSIKCDKVLVNKKQKLLYMLFSMISNWIYGYSIITFLENKCSSLECGWDVLPLIVFLFGMIVVILFMLFVFFLGLLNEKSRKDEEK